MKFRNDLDIFLDFGWVSVRQKNHEAAVVELTFLLALQMKHSCPVKKKAIEREESFWGFWLHKSHKESVWNLQVSISICCFLKIFLSIILNIYRTQYPFGSMSFFE